MRHLHAMAVTYIHARELGITVYSARIMISVKSAGLEIDVQVHYGITGYGVLRPGIQNKKGFCIKINLPKGNY